MSQIVTVFGGTGFLGRRIVRHWRAKGYSVRIASWHPEPPVTMIRSSGLLLPKFTTGSRLPARR